MRSDSSLSSYADFIFFNDGFLNLSDFFQMSSYLFQQKLQYINFFFFIFINFFFLTFVITFFLINQNYLESLKKYIWNFVIFYFYFFLVLYFQSNFFPLYYLFYKSVWLDLF